MAFVSFLLMLSAAVLFVLGIAGLVKRNGTAKKRFLWMGGAVILSIITSTWSTLALSFLLAAAVLLVMGITGVIERDGTARKRFLQMAAAFLLALITGSMIDSPKEEPAVRTEEVADVPVDSPDEAREGQDAEQASAPVTKKPAKETEKAHTMGSPIRTGDFEFVVASVKEDQIIPSSNEFIESYETENKLVIVDFTVKNLDKRTRAVGSNLFKLKDDQGNEYNPSDEYEITALLEEEDLIFEDVNPGLSKKGKVVFELPPDVAHYSLELSSGLGWSGGDYEILQLK
ncbi:DUF4352 domain-containing protein [Domibacillus sp. A3M-37]|uniref:DUF4352 domain-containing protein n=1 Tax=Domibacillus sp. A3M-37 TaxID=2962037 RepID=UPI0020B8E95A|nr:DUF4352 domain-containing protein [Domibacillus sp. A3M-37]MCP3764847.1 DUF4352 domain-containing protein [Domibacillus sp. A3M-37]